MTVETIDIRIREDGSRVVRANLDAIGASSTKSAGAVELLKRALVGIGAAAGLREALQLVDTYTTLQNRLRSTGLEGSNLTAVYRELLAASNETRSSLQGSVELYSRLAVSSKELGVSQKDLIQFTTSLNQAVLLSGATAHEAEAAIVQLSQGMASGTLRGDELRSVMEQLPAVADVIAKQMGVTRGELRKMGEQGKITAQTILQAFQAARGELAERFAKTVPTMAQSFQILKNNLVDFFGRLDQTLGLSTAISKGIMLVANNLDTLAAAVQRLTVVAGTFLAVWGLVRAGLLVNGFMASVKGALELSQAVAAGNVVILGSAQAERMRATAAAEASAISIAAKAQEEAATAALAAQQATAANMVATSKAREAAAQQAAVLAQREQVAALLAVNGANLTAARSAIAAAEAQGLQRVGAVSMTAAYEALAVAEAHHSRLLGTMAELDVAARGASVAHTQALTAQTAAQNALNVAQGRASATQATAAAASAGANAASGAAAAAQSTAAVSVFAQAWDKVKLAVSGAWGWVLRLFALINAHPFIALGTAILTVTGLLLGFGDKLDAGIDGVTTMKDVVVAFGQVAGEKLREFGALVSDVFSGIASLAGDALSAIGALIPSATSEWLKSFTSVYDGVGSGFAGMVRAIARTFDILGGVVLGVALGIIRTFAAIVEPVTANFKAMYNVGASIFEDLLNVVIDGANKVRGAVGATLIDTVKFTKLEVDVKTFEQYGADIANSMRDGFDMQGGFLEKSVNGIFDRAQQNSKQRAAEAFKQAENDYRNSQVNDRKGKPVAIPSGDDKALKRLQSSLESLISTIAPAEGAARDLAAAFDLLNKAQAAGLITAQDRARYEALAVQHYRDQIDPVGKLNRELDQQTALLHLNSREREVEGQMMQVVEDLQRQGITLRADETKAIRGKITALQDLNEQVRMEDQLLSDSVERRKEYVKQLQAMQRLLADPTSGFTKLDQLRVIQQEIGTEAMRGTKAELDIATGTLTEIYDKIAKARDSGALTPEDANTALKNATTDFQSQLQSTMPDLFEGTQEQLDLQQERFKQMYAQIDMLRQQDLISEQTAAQMKAKVAAAQHEVQLQNAHEFFGNLAVLSQSGNKKIAAIGKAAAVTQATIDGVLAVQKALASAPPPVNYALAAAVGISAAANVAKIMGVGFEEGGFTGNGARQAVAGVVHGKEFVVNADGTQKNRRVLELANKGIDLEAMFAQMTVPQRQMVGFESGGYVSPQGAPQYQPPAQVPTPVAARPVAPAAGVAGGTTLHAKIINVLDPSVVEDYLTSEAGQAVFVNQIRRNSDTVRAVLQES